LGQQHESSLLARAKVRANIVAATSNELNCTALANDKGEQENVEKGSPEDKVQLRRCLKACCLYQTVKSKLCKLGEMIAGLQDEFHQIGLDHGCRL
jgi:hypothetical protein